MTIWYTLAVIDEEGDITGENGAILVPSQPIEVVGSIQLCEVGQAVPFSEHPYIPPNESEELRICLSVDNPFGGPILKLRRYRHCFLAPESTGAILRTEALEAWERIE